MTRTAARAPQHPQPPKPEAHGSRSHRCRWHSGTSGAGGTLVISTDLPLQGASKDASDDTNNAVSMIIEQAGGKAGAYGIELKTYDDSTAAKGGWDDRDVRQERQRSRRQLRPKWPSWARTTQVAPRSRCRS